MDFIQQKRVRVRHTGEVGTIVGILTEELVSVRLDSDPSMHIPIYVDDLLAAHDTAALPILMGKTPKTPPPPPPRQTIKATTPTDNSLGVQVVFSPMPGKDDSIIQYKIWMVNPTQYDFLMEFDLYVLDKNPIRIDDFLSTNSCVEMGDLLADALNDAPEIEVTLTRITTAGEDEPMFKELKLRPKSFFKHYQHAPILYQPAYVFVLIEHFNDTEKDDKKAQKEEDLKTYTERQVKQKQRKAVSYGSLYEAFNPEAYAKFEPEIDLHIHALVNGHARIDPRETLRIQMQHFERFMDKAIRLGVPRVFIIHGVGEGKLRDAVAQRLRGMPEVAKFKNEYHHKYGYGATEVMF
jgi:hypothetical protein